MYSFAQTVKKEFLVLYKFRWVTYSFVSSNLKMRYKRSVIGIFWSMLGPALNYLIMGLVFSLLAKNSMPNYFAYLFSGAAFYNLMAAVINNGPYVFIHNEGYIKKIYLPKSLFVVNLVLMETINFMFSVGTLLLLGLIFNQYELSLSWLILPFVVLFAILFVFGLACILGVTCVYFRDINHILPLVMQASFFATPILYAVEALPENYQKLVRLNPFYYFVETFRSPIFLGQLPPLSDLGIVIGLSLLSFVIGLIVLKLFDNKIIFKL
ncbi:MAG: ABC transporter permease [Bdellovibrionaceae bacterium]|nr:ABC transporter permease [Pseudobdellovibrionaceae bacterium]NUM58629.1 ABC transporter permease [Pseudobdellovibrionaceae bacterium]